MKCFSLFSEHYWESLGRSFEALKKTLKSFNISTKCIIDKNLLEPNTWALVLHRFSWKTALNKNHLLSHYQERIFLLTSSRQKLEKDLKVNRPFKKLVNKRAWSTFLLSFPPFRKKVGSYTIGENQVQIEQRKSSFLDTFWCPSLAKWQNLEQNLGKNGII